MSFPRTEPPPQFVAGIVMAFQTCEESVCSERLAKGLTSDQVLQILRPHLEEGHLRAPGCEAPRGRQVHPSTLARTGPTKPLRRDLTFRLRILNESGPPPTKGVAATFGRLFGHARRLMSILQPSESLLNATRKPRTCILRTVRARGCDLPAEAATLRSRKLNAWCVSLLISSRIPSHLGYPKPDYHHGCGSPNVLLRLNLPPGR
jgi:hypothetical protein